MTRHVRLTLATIVLAGLLGGCAVYPDYPAYGAAGPGYYGGGGYAVVGGGYGDNGWHHHHDHGWHRGGWDDGWRR